VIRAVFFDFGGVVACLDRKEMRQIEEQFGVPLGGLWRAMYETPEWQALRVGHGSEESWSEAIRRELDAAAGRRVGEVIAEELWRCWAGLDSDVIAVLDGLRARYRVGMISNAKLTLEDELRRHGIYDRFDVIVNSARVGFAKPDRRIFHYAAESVGLQPSDCVHVDDLPLNVAGARDAGFHAIHYQSDASVLDRELRDLGIEW
jgi:putative hydrolase of the HAD superfamily